MRRLATLVLFLSALSVPAMHVRHTVRLFAWSTDGTSGLIEDQAWGPEGGSSTAFALLCHGSQVTAVLSSNFSAGGGQKPERVSRADCKERAMALKTAVESAGFDSVSVDPTKCNARDQVISHMGKTAVTDRLKDGWQRVTKGNVLVLTAPDETRLEVSGGGVASVSPSERAVIVLSGGDEPELVGAFRRDEGGPFVRCQ